MDQILLINVYTYLNMYIRIYVSRINSKENSGLPEADRITHVFSSKTAFPMVNKKLEPLFYIVYLMMSCSGSIISCTYAYHNNVVHEK